jgi:hypothetical protein
MAFGMPSAVRLGLGLGLGLVIKDNLKDKVGVRVRIKG